MEDSQAGIEPGKAGSIIRKENAKKVSLMHDYSPRSTELEAVIASTLNNWGVAHLQIGRVQISYIFLVTEGRLDPLDKFGMFYFLKA